MLSLIKPKALKSGDTVATVSLSWGGAGDENMLWRYEQGKRRIIEEFGLNVIEMPHTLSGTAFVYQNPQLRAKNLMDAFKNPDIKAVFACIGGTDSIRMLPYIDFNVIKKHPKIFMGYSDSTVTHHICMKAGISSIYGPSVLTDFAENIGMYEYTKNYLRKTLLSTEAIGEITASGEWTSEFLPWDIENKNTARKLEKNTGHELLQGSKAVRGRLIGGCIDVISNLRGTQLFPAPDSFDEAILFLESSNSKPSVNDMEDWFRWFGITGILDRINGIIVGKPYDMYLYDEYKAAILKILAEFNHSDLPVLYNMSFGHTAPICCLPYGAMSEINCASKSFRILESAVV